MFGALIPRFFFVIASAIFFASIPGIGRLPHPMAVVVAAPFLHLTIDQRSLSQPLRTQDRLIDQRGLKKTLHEIFILLVFIK
jgi:hypothetical protein